MTADDAALDDTKDFGSIKGRAYQFDPGFKGSPIPYQGGGVNFAIMHQNPKTGWWNSGPGIRPLSIFVPAGSVVMCLGLLQQGYEDVNGVKPLFAVGFLWDEHVLGTNSFYFSSHFQDLLPLPKPGTDTRRRKYSTGGIVGPT